VKKKSSVIGNKKKILQLNIRNVFARWFRINIRYRYRMNHIQMNNIKECASAILINKSSEDPLWKQPLAIWVPSRGQYLSLWIYDTGLISLQNPLGICSFGIMFYSCWIYISVYYLLFDTFLGNKLLVLRENIYIFLISKCFKCSKCFNLPIE